VGKSIPTGKYHWFEDDQVFVLWNWVWVEDDDEDIESRDCNEMSDGTSGNKEQSTDDDKEEDSDDGIPAITHCVVFKCLGYIKEHHYQEVLINASEKHIKGKTFQ